jgi:hypothetical protein
MLRTGAGRTECAQRRCVSARSPSSLELFLDQVGIDSHGRYVTFQTAEVAVSRQMFAEILLLIARLRAPPAPA